jgi:hypothetical protein
MRHGFGTLALAAALTAGASGIALAQTCPPGYFFQAGYCQPANPVSGAAAGGAAGAAAGEATGGPVGAVVGGALGTAAGAVSGAAGTVGAVTGAPPPGYVAPATCPPGMAVVNGACYPVR